MFALLKDGTLQPAMSLRPSLTSFTGRTLARWPARCLTESLLWSRFVYDEQGRLLGEYSPEGKLIAETIWFDGLPVATIRPQGANNQTPLGIVGTGKGTANNTGTNSSADPVYVDIFYVHPDHLGTPRVATRSRKQRRRQRWRRHKRSSRRSRAV